MEYLHWVDHKIVENLYSEEEWAIGMQDNEIFIYHYGCRTPKWSYTDDGKCIGCEANAPSYIRTMRALMDM